MHEVSELLGRYSPAQQGIIQQYFNVLAKTRKTGKVALSVLKKEMGYWSKYDPDMVTEALAIHLRKYPKKKEAYTRGILREIARTRSDQNHAQPGRSATTRGSYGRGSYGGRYIDGNEETKLPF